MSENNQNVGYGYEESQESSQLGQISFGLNQGIAKLTKFEWIPNGGKDGAEQEALDIEFTIQDRENPVRYRKFPVTKAYHEGQEITDPSHTAFKSAVADLNQVVSHILGCFSDKEEIKKMMTSKPITSFKGFCQAAMACLPKNFSEKSLDIFFQYQWNISDGKDKTYLELPKNMKQGKFLAPATTNVWQEIKTNKSLKYVDSTDPTIVHPFQRGEWFLNSNWANQQKEGGDETHEVTSNGSVGGW